MMGYGTSPTIFMIHLRICHIIYSISLTIVVVTKVQQPGVSKCRRVTTAAPPRCHRLATGLQLGCHRGAALPEASDMPGGKGYDVYYKATLAGLARRPAISSFP